MRRVADAGRWRAGFRAVFREPLTHFALLGVLIFVLHAATETLRRPVVRISAGELAQLDAYWRAQTGRPPDRAELRAMLDQRIDEEIMAAEARRLGLDRDDVIVRRRLAQKYAFVREDLGAAPEPDEATLRAHFAAHRAEYATSGGVSFRHLYFSAERGAGAQAAANAAMARLSQDRNATVDGDVFILPLSYESITPKDLARDYGDAFAAAVDAAPAGRWTGPIASSYGWHVVHVEARTASQTPAFEAVRDRVRDDWRDAALAKRREHNRQALRARYRIELPEDAPQ